MTVIENLNCDEEEAIQELRMRVKNAVTPDMYDDTLLFYRFLKARDFDVDKAELMLKKNIAWRKAFQVDTILNTFKTREFVVTYMRGNFVGFDKDGDILRYSPVGNIDIRDVTKCVKMNDYLKHCIFFSESDAVLLKQENERTGRNAYRVSFIFDLDKLALANVTNKTSTELFLRLTHLNQDNYPERMKALYIINAPAYFTLVYSVVKRVMSNAMIRKIHVFGQNGWQEALLKIMDADRLPAFLGGTRTDPDGNPDCNTFMFHGGKVSPEFYLTKEERSFKNMSQVKKIVVSQMSKTEIPVEVNENNSVLNWEFEVTNKDIGFGLYYQESEGKLKEILPVLKFETPDGTETGSYECQVAGTYVIVFDNSYSWISSKEIQYCVTIGKSENQISCFLNDVN